MAFNKKLKDIEKIADKISGSGKLSTAVLQKINYKFRLDWNYYSNKMEGNTLTIEETKNVMIGNIDVRNKPLKDVMEMHGHDKAIQTILTIGKGDLNILESRIRELHKAIMYEDDLNEQGKIGKWKEQPNQVINYKNEKFQFTTPYDVAPQMHELISWLNVENDKIKTENKSALNPVELAFDFHLKYLTIHPFYDGNGRTGRILTNLILISHGFPPIYIKDNDKSIYYRYLADIQAYGADKYLLFDILADYLLRSLNIVSDALEGKDISDSDDLDKRIQLLQTELNKNGSDNDIKIKYSKQVFIDSYQSWITKFIATVIPVIQKFNPLFTGTQHRIYMANSNVNVGFIDEPVLTVTEKLGTEIANNIERIGQPYVEMYIQTYYGSFIKGGLTSFGCNYSIKIQFHEIGYQVWVDTFDEEFSGKESIKMYEKLLHQELTSEEMVTVANMFGNTIFNHIDFSTKKNGLR